MSNIQEIFDKIQQDPDTKVDPEWVESWIQSIGNKEEEYHYLENKTLDIVNQEKQDTLSTFTNIDKEKWLTSLSMYRYVEDLQSLRLGYHIRWIRERPSGTFTLTNGGIFVRIKFTDSGTYIVCKNYGKFMQYKLDECPTFQKINAEEWLILMANSQ
jgi:hypothetical protein